MKVAFIGAGAMGRAIAEGAARKQPNTWSFTFYDLDTRSADLAARATGGQAAYSVEGAVRDAQMVILAVKPQVQSKVIRSLPNIGRATLVSIAAGRSLSTIATDLEHAGLGHVPTVRVMPNLNALVGSATTAICANVSASERRVAAVQELFAAVGTTFLINEELFPVFTAMAGSSPAWFFQIVEDLARAGVKHGLTKSQATEAVCSTMAGSALMLQSALAEGGNAAALVDRVCSPGGTTIAGLLAAQDAGLGSALVKAVDATVERDRELGAS